MRKYIFLLMVFFSTNLGALEGYEHRILSEAAFKIAISYQCNKLPGRCEEIKLISKQLYPDLASEKFSYGQIAELVDYINNPIQIFTAQNASKRTYPQSVADLNKYAIRLLKEHEDEFTLDFVHASSQNESHFQSVLLKTMSSLHNQAIYEAQQGELFSALVTNALSDHYLQDYFAPGHITTPRENTHDNISLALHDKGNQIGVCYQLDEKPEILSELNDVFSFMSEQQEFDLDFIKECSEEGSNREYCSMVEGNYDPNIVRSNINQCTSREFTGTVPANNGALTTKSSQKAFIKELAFMTNPKLNTGEKRIYIQGDNHLINQPKQQLLMVAVQVRSILEVLDNYLNRNMLNQRGELRVTDYRWRGLSAGESDGVYKCVTAPEATIKYGKYVAFSTASDCPLVDTDNFDALDLDEQLRYTDNLLGKSSDLLFFSIGGQAPIEGNSSHLEIASDYIPLGLYRDIIALDSRVPRPASECDLFGSCNFAVAFGGSYVSDDEFTAKGLRVRAIKAFPKIDSVVNIYVKRMKYSQQNDKHYRWVPGVRFDIGFSMHSFYIGLEKGYLFDQDELDKSVYVTFGWTFGVPTSRL